MDNFDLKKFVSGKTLLNENAPGYDTRKTGEPLPTLESVKAAYEAKGDKSMADMDFRPGVGKDSTWAPTRKQQRAAEKEIKEGIWAVGNPDDIQKFISILVELKNDYWNVVGSDTVADGLDTAIKGANELLGMKMGNVQSEGFDIEYNNINEGIINEAKKSELDKKLAEIDKAGAITTLEAKINAIDEAIEAKNSRINMVQEDENLSELIDKKRVKEMQKEIKLLERSKKLYEKQLDKANGKKKAKKEIVDEYNIEPHNSVDEIEYKY